MIKRIKSQTELTVLGQRQRFLHRLFLDNHGLKGILFITVLLISGCQSTPLSSVSTSKLDTHDTDTAHQPQDQPLKLATITPVVESMALALTQHTHIEVVYLPSKRYSIKRIPGWLKKQDHNAFPNVDAIAGISSVWKDMDAYPSFRLQNIQVVPIDLAYALIPGGERVAITHRPYEQTTRKQTSYKQQNSTPSYFWLNPSNALIMVGILNRDLKALVKKMSTNPETTEQTIKQLNQNQTAIEQSLRAFQVALDEKLMEQGVMQVTTDKPELRELMAATLLPDVSLSEAKQSGFPTLLITSRKASHKRVRDLPAHIKVWSIDDFGKVKSASFNERWIHTLGNL